MLVTEHLAPSLVEGDFSTGDVPVPGAKIGTVDHQSLSSFRGLGSQSSFDQCRDFVFNRDEARDLSRFVAERLDVDIEPVSTAVFTLIE